MCCWRPPHGVEPGLPADGYSAVSEVSKIGVSTLQREAAIAGNGPLEAGDAAWANGARRCTRTGARRAGGHDERGRCQSPH